MATIGSLKNKGGTPEHLDVVIRNRETIGEEEYTEFWQGFNKLKKESLYEKDLYVDLWISDHFGVEDEDFEDAVIEHPEEPLGPEIPIAKKREKRIVRKSKGWATRDAKRIGGKVVRVDRFGKRNPRGRSFKAVLR